MWTLSTLAGQIHDHDSPAQPKAAFRDRSAPKKLRHVVPAPQSHERVLATPDQPDGTETRSHPHPYTAGGKPTSQGTDPPPTHLSRPLRRPGQSREPPSESRDQGFVHTPTKQNPSDEGGCVPEVGLELSSRP